MDELSNLRNDLEKYYESMDKSMGRTALRYAIEHFPEEERLSYLKGKR